MAFSAAYYKTCTQCITECNTVRGRNDLQPVSDHHGRAHDINFTSARQPLSTPFPCNMPSAGIHIAKPTTATQSKKSCWKTLSTVDKQSMHLLGF